MGFGTADLVMSAWLGVGKGKSIREVSQHFLNLLLEDKVSVGQHLGGKKFSLHLNPR